MENRRYLVNEQGEVLRELDGTDRILTNGQTKYVNGTVEVKFNFCKINVNSIEEIDRNLKSVMLLLKYIEIGTGILKYLNGRTITSAKDLGRKLGFTERAGQKLVKQLIEDDIIHRNINKKGVYFTFNPYIAHIGKRVPKDLADDFKNSKWRKISDEDKR